MSKIERELTQLENKLFEKVNYIEQFAIQRKYFPKRVEPRIGFEIDKERNWSKFMGETLFINQEFLNKKEYSEPIFWREAYLLFAPIVLRDSWWVKILANVFPLSHRLTSNQQEMWESLIKNISSEYSDLINKCKLISATAGPEGLIKALKTSLYQIYSKLEENNKETSQKKRIIRLTPQEFDIILSDLFYDSVKITENAVSIMETVLLKNTIKTKEIADFSSKNSSVVSKTINRLLAMNVLRQQYSINYFALGLTQYVVLLICTKKQSQLFRSLPKNPYLFSQKFNCLNTCVITQYYVAPRTKLFYKKLIEYCKKHKQNNRIVEFYAFEITSSFRNFLFKYFNPKTKKQDINFNDIVIESDFFDTNLDTNISLDQLNIGNIVMPTGITDYNPIKIDLIDLQILNQFASGNSNRRIIQKNLKRDMNKIVKRIKRLFDKKVLYEHIWAVLPDSNCEVTFYLEGDSQKKTSNENLRPLKDRLKQFCYYLPNVYFAQIRGSYDGMLLRSFLPHSITLTMADFFNWYLPENVNNQIILGISNFQKYRGQLNENRWNDGNWLFSDEDFEF
ncbi:MAG: hypothetical protein FK730_01225 [Asgard group archaeon]|nr:hypothetical protein [Asgard group archaeon]